MAWVHFGLCALLIIVAGPVLTRQAHVIAPRWGLSDSWAGMVLLATATSLPELITGLSSVTAAGAPNLAVGDILGSCIFNLALLAVLDLLSREGSLFNDADQGHVLSAALGTLMISVAGAALIVARAGLDVVIWHVSIYSLLLIVMYAIAMRALYLHGRAPAATRLEVAPGPLLSPVAKYAGAALVVALAGAWLPFAGLDIAEMMGWNTSFVGTLLLAATTSLPELVVMGTALRMRCIDMAIAGLLGSNLFDVAILAIDDMAYVEGSLFAAVSPGHAGSAFGAAIMGSVVIISIIDRPTVRVFGRIGWASIFLIAIYVVSAYAIFLLGH